MLHRGNGPQLRTPRAACCCQERSNTRASRAKWTRRTRMRARRRSIRAARPAGARTSMRQEARCSRTRCLAVGGVRASARRRLQSRGHPTEERVGAVLPQGGRSLLDRERTGLWQAGRLPRRRECAGRFAERGRAQEVHLLRLVRHRQLLRELRGSGLTIPQARSAST